MKALWSRFTTGAYGVLYAADRFETALAETIHHHECFMACTAEPEGWTSPFRETILDVNLEAHDPRGDPARFGDALLSYSYAESQALAADLRAAGSEGIPYLSCRKSDGERCDPRPTGYSNCGKSGPARQLAI